MARSATERTSAPATAPADDAVAALPFLRDAVIELRMLCTTEDSDVKLMVVGTVPVSVTVEPLITVVTVVAVPVADVVDVLEVVVVVDDVCALTAAKSTAIATNSTKRNDLDCIAGVRVRVGGVFVCVDSGRLLTRACNFVCG